MGIGRARSDATGDVVRRRLAELVAEIQVREASGDPARASPGTDHEPTAEAAHAEAAPDAAAQVDAGPRRAATSPLDRGRWLHRSWEFGRPHLAVAAILGLVGVVWAVWGATEARTVPVVATPASPQAVTATPSPTPETILVHVTGAVVKPGVVRLPPGARVIDALDQAGGLTAGARLGELNLAAVVADGAQVVVGDGDRRSSEVRQDQGGGADPSTQSGQSVNLNTATLAQLDALPGVGPVTAQRILAWREAHRRFSRVEELLEVEGIGQKTFAQLRQHVRV